METSGSGEGHRELTPNEAAAAFVLAVAAGGGFLAPEAKTGSRLRRELGLTAEETGSLGPEVLDAAAGTWQELGKQGIA